MLQLIKIFESSFGGATLYANDDYVSPNLHRRMVRMRNAHKYDERQMAVQGLKEAVGID